MIAYAIDPRLRNVQNTYILNLAICDFFVGCVDAPIAFWDIYHDWIWVLPQPVCDFWMFVEYTWTLESVTSVILISWDRYKLVTQGASYQVQNSIRKAVVHIVVTWVVVIAFYAPSILGWRAFAGFSVLKPTLCEVEFLYNFPFTLTKNILTIVIPGALLIVVNVKVYRNIAARTRRFKQTASHTLAAPTSTDATLSKDRRAARSLFILVVAFIVMWAPWAVNTTLSTLCHECWNDYAYMASYWLLYLNSLVNPLLYAAGSPRFRVNYKRIWCCYLFRTKGIVHRITDASWSDARTQKAAACRSDCLAVQRTTHEMATVMHSYCYTVTRADDASANESEDNCCGDVGERSCVSDIHSFNGTPRPESSQERLL
ncbi:PREDICTED: histamine H3 receptor-like [Priapulus caudatus]|uniref:Histamine H3 receptor-like n=1 Tax=Priapulus caudatus TaxID=37621 RepID=A0ABM1EA17_PRICU|nr:PREDICTED: histamine H3 receptor-like [Priapulus caudatus]